MIDSNNKLKSLSKSLIESARKIMTEKKTDKDLAKLAPPYDKVTHGDVLVGRKVYTHDQVKAHKAKKGIKEDADMVVVNAPVLADIDGELAEVLKRDPRDKTVHIQLEGMKYILKKGQYAELDEAVKNPYAVGMAAAMKSTGDKPPLKKSTIVKAHKIAKKVAEEVEDLDEGLETQTIKHPVGQRPKGVGWTLKQAGEQTGKDHSVWQRKVKKAVAEEVEQIDELSKKTLKSYQKKATTSSEKAWNKADKEEDKAMSTDGTKYPEKQERHMKAAGDAIKTWRKREAGLGLAKQKLAKEEVEDLDEAYTIRSKGYNNVEVVHKGKVVGRFNDPHSARMHVAKLNKNASVKEEVEDLDELYKTTLKSYIKKAGRQAANADDSAEHLKGLASTAKDKTLKTKAQAAADKHTEKSEKRLKGIRKAVGKLDRGEYEPGNSKLAKEEFDQIDELSKGAVSNYANRAFDQSNSILKSRNLDLPKSVKKSAEDAKERRRKGIVSAGKRLGDDEMKKISQASANRIVYNKEDVELSQEEIQNIEAILADLDDESED